MGAVLGSTVMISIQESTSGSGLIESYSYGLLAGALTAIVAIALATKLTPTDRSIQSAR
jgi:hypothetical protein